MKMLVMKTMMLVIMLVMMLDNDVAAVDYYEVDIVD